MTQKELNKNTKEQTSEDEKPIHVVKIIDSRDMLCDKIKILRLRKCNRFDIIYNDNDIEIPYGKKHTIYTNIQCEIPENIIGMITNNSDSYSNSWTLTNGPLFLDSDFCGEIVLEITSTDQKTITLNNKDKIAQLAFIETCKVNLVTIDNKKESLGGSIYESIIDS